MVTMAVVVFLLVVLAALVFGRGKVVLTVAAVALLVGLYLGDRQPAGVVRHCVAWALNFL